MRPSLVFALCLFAPALASAQVVISEVMYDLAEGSDSGREWIEVYNAGASPVALTQWKLFENGAHHKITSVQGGDALPPGTYAVIADNVEKFRSDHPAFVGQLFDSAFSLSNAGETVALRDGQGADIDVVAYAEAIGGSGTGDSLQRTATGWEAGMPTPGAAVPASGLQKSPSKEKTARTQAARGIAASTVSIIGEPMAKEGGEMTLAPSSSATTLFLLGAGLLAGAGSVGVVMSRARRRSEWEIEEIR